ncbi:hypothetical protein ABZP36_015635, partial [Zizania latifolia]
MWAKIVSHINGLGIGRDICRETSKGLKWHFGEHWDGQKGRSEDNSSEKSQ